MIGFEKLSRFLTHYPDFLRKISIFGISPRKYHIVHKCSLPENRQIAPNEKGEESHQESKCGRTLSTLGMPYDPFADIDPTVHRVHLGDLQQAVGPNQP